ncbi:hypothetical protein AM2_0681 [Lactococcus cremoris]|nr:hypothetical protein llh_11665 [Lactococcus cremoris subsp. cremoris A76]KZK04880.1 hypothetical protein AB995_2508 [Lactococcus cremoris]KZK34354.1 hypothetical protein LMG6897_2253 [Lactococcus cremoris]KZK39868.1 hypothetical protein B40_2490 [Lactococcus cremoris]KZK44572.1 hypothetical protein FG2_1960 [Lactococcus cremoris]
MQRFFAKFNHFYDEITFFVMKLSFYQPKIKSTLKRMIILSTLIVF